MDSRRRYLIANAIQKKGGYVTDGLILHLDGIDYGGQEHKWLDLVNGVEFYNDYSDGYSMLQHKENCYSFATGWRHRGFKNRTGFLPVTIEFVLNNKSTNNNTRYLFSSTDSNKNIVFNQDGNLQVNGYASRAKSVECSKNAIHYISTNYSDVYIDEVKITDFKTSYNQGATWSSGCSIGASAFIDQCYIGDIYSFRIYNRILTAEEIAQNFAVDKVRFSIPD